MLLSSEFGTSSGCISFKYVILLIPVYYTLNQADHIAKACTHFQCNFNCMSCLRKVLILLTKLSMAKLSRYHSLHKLFFIAPNFRQLSTLSKHPIRLHVYIRKLGYLCDPQLYQESINSTHISWWWWYVFVNNTHANFTLFANTSTLWSRVGENKKTKCFSTNNVCLC